MATCACSNTPVSLLRRALLLGVGGGFLWRAVSAFPKVVKSHGLGNRPDLILAERVGAWPGGRGAWGRSGAAAAGQLRAVVSLPRDLGCVFL